MDLINNIIENKILFNDLTDSQYSEFIQLFDELSLLDKKIYLSTIIDNTPEDLLLKGNFKKLFELPNFIKILRDIVS